MLIGYARVSTVEQDTALQLDALHAAGVTCIYSEHGSGVGPRPRLQEALARVCVGDTLVVWKIDRLARSLADLLAILQRLERAGAAIRSLTEPIDTSTPIGAFVVQILGAVAELERSIIRERSMAGVRAARDRGAVMGRPVRLTAQARAEMHAHWLTGCYSVQELADLYGVSYSTAYRAVHP
jgi:DNA invertase Pin-like site-specific DNA recombinase